MKFLILIFLSISTQSFAAETDWAAEQKRVIEYKLTVFCKQFFEGEKLLTESNRKKMIAIKFCKGDFEAPPCLKTRAEYNIVRKKYLASVALQKELGATLDKHKTVLHLKENDPYSSLCEPLRAKIMEENSKNSGQKK